MSLFPALFSPGLQDQLACQEILACNADSARYGLTLSFQQAAQLAVAQSAALRSTMRIEWGGGVLPPLIRRFRISPYLHPGNYTAVLEELMQLFYHYKSESLECLSDDALLDFMQRQFDGPCRGSLELLAAQLDRVAASIRAGGAAPEAPDREESRDE